MSSYTYSLNHNHLPTSQGDDSLLGIIIDFAPIKLIAQRRFKKTFAELIANLFAIIIGSSVIGGVLFRVLNFYKNYEEEKEKED